MWSNTIFAAVVMGTSCEMIAVGMIEDTVRLVVGISGMAEVDTAARHT